jgi:transposase
MSVAADMALLESYEETLVELKLYLAQQAKVHDSAIFYLLRSIPGIGKILSMTILYEVQDISRFAGVGNFLSYARLVRGSWEQQQDLRTNSVRPGSAPARSPRAPGSSRARARSSRTR